MIKSVQFINITVPDLAIPLSVVVPDMEEDTRWIGTLWCGLRHDYFKVHGTANTYLTQFIGAHHVANPVAMDRSLTLEEGISHADLLNALESRDWRETLSRVCRHDHVFFVSQGSSQIEKTFVRLHYNKQDNTLEIQIDHLDQNAKPIVFSWDEFLAYYDTQYTTEEAPNFTDPVELMFRMLVYVPADDLRAHLTNAKYKTLPPSAGTW